MRSLFDDARFAVRSFARSPAFTLTSVFTVAIGIAAVTTVFALINGLLLKPLPVDRADELVEVAVTDAAGSRIGSYSWPQYERLVEQARGVTGLAAWSLNMYGASAGEEPEALLASDVSANYFDVLGVRPALGRFFAPDDHAVMGANAEVVVSYAYWQTRLGGARDAIGSTIRINAQPFTVIGVAPVGFHGTVAVLNSELWVPLSMYDALHPTHTSSITAGNHYFLNVFGRLQPGTTRAQTASMLAPAAAAVDELRPNRRQSADAAAGEAESSPASELQVRLVRLTHVPGELRGGVTGFLGLLLVAAALVLTIAGVNIASMLLARATTRGREIGVRLSLGASRRRLVRQLLTESTLLFVLGGALGLLLAAWLVAFVAGLQPPVPVPLSVQIGIDWRVAAFAFAAALAAGGSFGLAPALHGTRRSVHEGMREAGDSPRGMRLRSGFVVAQLALSLLLLICAGLFARALSGALDIDPGIDARGVAFALVDLGPYGYDETAGVIFYDRLREQLLAHPEVADVALSRTVPLGGDRHRWTLRPEGYDEAPAGGIDVNIVDGAFFRTLRIPLLAGRAFDERDHTGAAAVAIVNEAFVRQHWPDGNPIGRRLYRGERVIEVIGVVPTGRYHSLQEEPVPLVHLPFSQHYEAAMHVYVRGAAGADALLGAVREVMRSLDRSIPVARAMSLDAAVSNALFAQRFAAAAVGSFGGAGLLLAAIGLYGIIAFMVGQRRREIGIRMALGARTADVVRMIGAHGMKLLVLGSLIGLAAALLASRALESFLIGVSPTDPLTFVAVPLLLASVAALAAYLPARRASRVDPVSVLRQE